MYDAIFFDLDGTLTDPKVGITKSVQYALAKYGIHEKNLDNLTPFIGPPLMDSFQEFYSFSPQQARQAMEYYREYFAATGIYENVVYPGIQPLLERLTSAGKRLIVATSKPTLFSQQILRHFALDDYFDFVVGSNMDGTRTAKTEVIEAAVDQIRAVSKKRMIMVGDRKFDVIGAQNNGIAAAAVLYGYGSEAELEQTGPEFLAASVEELNDILGAGDS